MANPDLRQTENVAGTFFVDATCISCEACWKAAPGHFASHPVHTYAYVRRQPTGDSETQDCLRAMKLCPAGAIGKTEK